MRRCREPEGGKLTKISWIAAAATTIAALQAAAPAASADGLTCILDAIPANARTAITTSFNGNNEPSEAGVSAIQAAMPACVERLGWSREAANAAVEFAVSSILLDDMARNGPFSAAQILQLDHAFDVLPVSVGAGLRVNGELGEDNAQTVGEAAAATGVPINERSGNFIGAYFSARWMVGDVRRRFAAL